MKKSCNLIIIFAVCLLSLTDAFSVENPRDSRIRALEQRRTNAIEGQIDVSRIPLNEALVMGDETAPRKVIVFTSTNCTYCANLFFELKKIVEMRRDIVFYMKLVSFPKDDLWKAKSIVCSKSIQMLEDNYLYKEIPRGECNTYEVESNEKLVRGLGGAVPALVMPDNSIHRGFITADRLLALIDSKQGMIAQGRSLPVAPPPSPPQPDEKLPPTRSDAFAVVIGIDYKGRKDMPALQYASQDAKKIYNILTDPRYGGVPKENAVLLLNEKATRNEVIAALRKIKTWDGYLYVYFSGHGAPKTRGDKMIDGFLVPYDVVITDPDAMEDTSIRTSYLQELVDSSQAKGVLVALDACFSGGGKSIVPQGGKPLVGMLVTPEIIKPKGAGKVVITSSAANQQSWEDEAEIKGGIFTHYLLEGLKGKASMDVWVNANELSAYIKENVPKSARKLKGVEQIPQIAGKGDFAVTRNWEKARAADAETAKAKLKNAFEKGNISAEQLSRAMDELKKQAHTKTLDAFLEGKIDERKFGDLY